MRARAMRWAGIDEAGYGPNLGPLVMTAVVAEGETADDRRPDLWSDLPATVSRAGGPAGRLWVDDSKAILRGGQGLDRLEEAMLATLAAIHGATAPRSGLSELLAVLGSGSFDEIELDGWLEPGDDPNVPASLAAGRLAETLARRPLEAPTWRIVAARAVVVGPLRFNRESDAAGSKTGAHFSAFASLLRWIWESTAEGAASHVRADKHGGRHFYLDPLYRALPDTWIDRGVEGPELSTYTARSGERRLTIDFLPKADADDGLVALASIISKALREYWMAAFNAHWTSRVPGLRPTAGYPVDAARFRSVIEPHCRDRGLDPDAWWRKR